jgi:hypothetical protein
MQLSPLLPLLLQLQQATQLLASYDITRDVVRVPRLRRRTRHRQLPAPSLTAQHRRQQEAARAARAVAPAFDASLSEPGAAVGRITVSEQHLVAAEVPQVSSRTALPSLWCSVTNSWPCSCRSLHGAALHRITAFACHTITTGKQGAAWHRKPLPDISPAPLHHCAPIMPMASASTPVSCSADLTPSALCHAATPPHPCCCHAGGGG